jgi:predicted esterase
MNPADPHHGGPVLAFGRPLEEASGVLILLHGRGDSAAGILGLAEVLDQSHFAYLAPQAAGNTWYPYSFLAPIEDNEPGISSGIAALGAVVESVAAAGLPYERIVVGGFSQGACLATEFVARNARRYGGVLGFSGGLIGPEGAPRDYAGSLNGTPIFLGCSDVDFHIPKERVELTAQVLEKLGARVTMRLYPGMGHTINQDEIDFGRQILETVAGQ